jgi:putative protein-disulfide isomerase
MPTTLWYVHDPMCSWCFAFRPTLAALQARLPEAVAVKRLLGGLAPDTDEPMPEAMQAYLQATWQRIEERVPGTRFNFDFWTRCRPRRATWPACRAVIAARAFHPAYEAPMVEAIQNAYYRQARNPSETDTLVALANELGLDTVRFVRLLDAPETHSRLSEEMGRARAMGVDAFPSLVLEIDAGRWRVAVDYNDPEAMALQVDALLTAT